MAALIRFQRIQPLAQRAILAYGNRRNISTSKKNSEAAANTCSPTSTPAAEDKNWVSYGFDYESKEDDTNYHHATFFFSVTLCLVWGGFSWAYAPDNLRRDWTQREAFLELRRRENAGLPPISPNYVDPKTVKLPSEDELECVEIII